ncbi:MAG TPA: hypothetical protein DCQ98_07975, partial [Planctomycetaceae bacterium]|nr:hypothetical protein [Planctomycetaceae bacterium]
MLFALGGSHAATGELTDPTNPKRSAGIWVGRKVTEEVAPTWARVVPDARPCDIERSRSSEGAIGVAAASPRLGT